MFGMAGKQISVISGIITLNPLNMAKALQKDIAYNLPLSRPAFLSPLLATINGLKKLNEDENTLKISLFISI
tara:strand:- start:1157 stop:1372 length:216 start_codon:yes stop_codon:yes gene_type:complete